MEAPLTLALGLGFERSVTITRDLDLHGADLSDHRLGPSAVPGVSAITSLHRVLRTAEVRFHLDLETRFEDLLGELTQQAARPDQVDTLVAGVGHEPLRDRRIDL